MNAREVRLGATVEVRLSSGVVRRRGRVLAGPFIRYYDAENSIEIWQVVFPSGHSSELTARELRHPDPITRLADLA